MDRYPINTNVRILIYEKVPLLIEMKKCKENTSANQMFITTEIYKVIKST